MKRHRKVCAGMKEYKGRWHRSRDLWWTSSSPGMRCPPSRTPCGWRWAAKACDGGGPAHRRGHRPLLYALPSEGIGRGMEVKPWGGPISVPVGRACWAGCSMCWGSHRRQGSSIRPGALVHPPTAPSFADQRPVVDLFETGIKVIDLLAPMPGAARSACLAALRWAKRC